MSDARDPYLGLNNHIRQQAREQTPAYYAIGKIISLRPLVVRAAGMDLDKDDLRIPQRFRPETACGIELFAIQLGEDSEGEPIYERVTLRDDEGAVVAAGRLDGRAHIRLREPEEDELRQLGVGLLLAVGDEVLLIPSADGQLYYMVDKLVEVDA